MYVCHCSVEKVCMPDWSSFSGGKERKGKLGDTYAISVPVFASLHYTI